MLYKNTACNSQLAEYSKKLFKIAKLQSFLSYTASYDTSRVLWNVVKYTSMHQYIKEKRQKKEHK
jgi:hypothetical protein